MHTTLTSILILHNSVKYYLFTQLSEHSHLFIHLSDVPLFIQIFHCFANSFFVLFFQWRETVLAIQYIKKSHHF